MVWSSQLGAKEKHVGEAAELMPDRRALHYWDGDQLIGRAFQDHLGLPMPAWDVWLLVEPGIRWDSRKAPAPSWWEHQLRGMPSERRLDPGRFAARARELLASTDTARAVE